MFFLPLQTPFLNNNCCCLVSFDPSRIHRDYCHMKKRERLRATSDTHELETYIWKNRFLFVLTRVYKSLGTNYSKGSMMTLLCHGFKENIEGGTSSMEVFQVFQHAGPNADRPCCHSKDVQKCPLGQRATYGVCTLYFVQY